MDSSGLFNSAVRKIFYYNCIFHTIFIIIGAHRAYDMELPMLIPCTASSTPPPPPWSPARIYELMNEARWRGRKKNQGQERAEPSTRASRVSNAKTSSNIYIYG
ncbi:unnamed protein product, partial [Trichogramma brassicae]